MTVLGWWAGFVAYLIALLLTGQAGPFVALWLWSALAVPGLVTAARARIGRLLPWLAAWAVLAVVLPLVGDAPFDALPPTIRSDASLLIVLLVCAWPLVITVLAHRLLRAGTREVAS